MNFFLFRCWTEQGPEPPMPASTICACLIQERDKSGSQVRKIVLSVECEHLPNSYSSYLDFKWWSPWPIHMHFWKCIHLFYFVLLKSEVCCPHSATVNCCRGCVLHWQLRIPPSQDACLFNPPPCCLPVLCLVAALKFQALTHGHLTQSLG